MNDATLKITVPEGVATGDWVIERNHDTGRERVCRVEEFTFAGQPFRYLRWYYFGPIRADGLGVDRALFSITMGKDEDRPPPWATGVRCPAYTLALSGDAGCQTSPATYFLPAR